MRRIDTGDVSLAVLEAGVGGRPLLLVHGFTGAKEDFAEHLAGLAALGWHAVAPDLRGHGQSDHPEGGYDFGTMTADLVVLADDLGWDRFVLLGHSMGGVLAQALVLDHPERVAALVLMDTTGAAAGVDAALVELACEIVLGEGMAALAEAQRKLGNPLETDAGRRLRETRPDWDAYSDGKLLASAPAMYVAMSRALTQAESRLKRLATLQVPTLVMVGELDRPFYDDSVTLATVIPGAELAVIPGAGHSPQHECPAAWFDAVKGFLSKH